MYFYRASNWASETAFRTYYQGVTGETIASPASDAGFDLTGTRRISNEQLIDVLSTYPDIGFYEDYPTWFRVGTKEPYSLAPYKITLPTNSSGGLTGAAQEILQPAMMTYTGTYFAKTNGEFVFSCPDGGATTSGASFARCELRDLTNHDLLKENFDTVRFRVDALPVGTTIVHQVHSLTEEDPWCKIVFGNGRLRALVKITDGASDTEYVLNNSVSIGTVYRTNIHVKNGNLTISCGGVTHNITMNRTGQYYFKRGNYYQNNGRIGNVCVVAHV